MSSQPYGRTCLAVRYPWGLMLRKGSRLLCSDGKVRAPAYLSSTPDTAFSTPCGMRVAGKYVRGYMTVEEQKGPGTLRAYVFRQFDGQVSALPDWPSWPKYDGPSWEDWKTACSAADVALSALVASAYEGGGV